MTESRDAYVEWMKRKLDEWNADIARLEAKAGQLDADAREQYQQQIHSLVEHRKKVEETLDEIRKSGESAWEDVKTGADLATKAMKEAVSSAMSRFS